MRLLNDLPHMDDPQLFQAQLLISKFFVFTGHLLSLYYTSSNGFTPTIDRDERQDLQPLFTLCMFMLNTSGALVQYTRWLKIPPDTTGFARALLCNAPFDYATPVGYEDAARAEEIPLEDSQVQHLYVINLVNLFGQVGGWAHLFNALHHPDRLGLEGLATFLVMLQAATPLFKTSQRQVVVECCNEVVNFVGMCFQAAPDFRVLEEQGGGRQAHVALSSLLHALHTTLHSSLGIFDSLGIVAPLQQELVLRLLRSGNFTQQLSGVKELHGILSKTGLAYSFLHKLATDAAAAVAKADRGTREANQGADADRDGDQEQRAEQTTGSVHAVYFTEQQQLECQLPILRVIEWIKQNNVAQEVIKSNLHLTQYSEQAQKVLALLLKHKCLGDEQLEFLWQLTADASTFEDIKTNVHTMLVRFLFC